MPDLIIPRWQSLEAVIQKAMERVTLFTPYYSRYGIQKVRQNFRLPIGIDFWTRLSISDWANGFADPEALHDCLKQVEHDGKEYSLRIQRSLHAKAYFADQSIALIGSSNLTNGGFETNVEAMFLLEGTDAANALETLSFSAEPKAKRISLAELSEWIEKNKGTVQNYRRNNKSSFDEIEEAEHESDQETTEAIVEPTAVILDGFIEWLARNIQYAGAAELVELHDDKVVQRRQGHVKQCFSGVYRFLQMHPSWIQRLAEAVTNDDGVHQPDSQLVKDWSEHLETHALDGNSLYSYPTLRGILKPNLGGVLQGSGGGGSLDYGLAAVRSVAFTLRDAGLDDEQIAELFERVTLAETGGNATPLWNAELNRRRFELIDRDIQGNLSRAEQFELARLTQIMRKHVDSEANLPMEGVRKLHSFLTKSGPGAMDSDR